MESYKTSKAWHIGHNLAVDIHALARGIPASDHYNLNTQLRRASASVPLLIEQSIKQELIRDKHRSYQLAREAAAELHEHLLLAYERNYLDRQSFEASAAQAISIYHLLSGVIRATKVSN